MSHSHVESEVSSAIRDILEAILILLISMIEAIFHALDFEQKAFAKKQCAIPLPWSRLTMFYNFI